VRGAHLHGPVDAVQAGQAVGVCALHAARRAGHQPVSHQLSAGLASGGSHRAAVTPHLFTG
jgi:hypothetical protein